MRQRPQEQDKMERRHNFLPVEENLTPEQVKAEAARCLTCKNPQCVKAFSAFINDQSLNQQQIAFVHKIIQYIELNGYIENISELTKPPFDKPVSFIKLFDSKYRTAIVEIVNGVRDNAVNVIA